MKHTYINYYLEILIISTLALLGSCAFLNAKITDFDQKINENIEKYTPVYGFGDGIIDSVEVEVEEKLDDTTHKIDLDFVLKLEKPALVKPEPWAVYGEKFLGYTNQDSQIQLYKRGPSSSNSKKTKQPIEELPIGGPLAIVPGDYSWEYKDSSGNIHIITAKIEEHWLPIEIKDSGWISTDYKDARVFKVILLANPLSRE